VDEVSPDGITPSNTSKCSKTRGHDAHQERDWRRTDKRSGKNAMQTKGSSTSPISRSLVPTVEISAKLGSLVSYYQDLPCQPTLAPPTNQSKGTGTIAERRVGNRDQSTVCNALLLQIASPIASMNILRGTFFLNTTMPAMSSPWTWREPNDTLRRVSTTPGRNRAPPKKDSFGLHPEFSPLSHPDSPPATICTI